MKLKKYTKFTFFLSFAAVLALAGCDNPSVPSTGDSVSASASESTSITTNIDGDGYVDKLPENVEDGVILHCFDWTFKQIEDNLDAIASLGYRAVQTSPVQQPKAGGASWMFFYQPVSFSIATSSPLGGVEELTSLCEKAEEKGIAVISDIVFNHMATTGGTNSDGTPTVDPEVQQYEPYIYNNQDTTFHHSTNSSEVTQYYSGLPDLNTANSHVQERAYSLLKECIDAGVDGFRFDAAKHIETPDDASYPSDFWTNTLGKAKTYYKEKTDNDLFAYGEILNEIGNDRPVSNYTKFMKVTDNQYVSGVYSPLYASKTDANTVAVAAYGKNTDASNLVTWMESHDTYMDDENSSGNHRSARSMYRLWAIVTARKDTQSLFFARPDSGLTVANIGTYEWDNEYFGAANRFHNRFIGAEEYQHAYNTSIYINERYSDSDAGAIVVDCDQLGTAEVEFSHLSDGWYFDQITGKSVLVYQNKATIEFDSLRLCILTRSKNAPRASFSASQRGGLYAGSLTVELSVTNATQATVKVDNGEAISWTESYDLVLGNDIAAGTITTVTVWYTNGQIEQTRTMVFEKISLIDGYFNIINLDGSYLTDYELYIWSWTGTSSTYSKSYTVDEVTGYVLIENSVCSNWTGFLLAVFEKGHTPSPLTAWDSSLIKQTSDIDPSAGFFDASTF